jgi:hypothetical protein
VRFTVGGESFEFDPEDVERAMRGEVPELHQKYIVEVGGTQFPPKQVFAKISGRNRQSFTTMEAQRVLTRLGFVCREADRPGFVKVRFRPEFLDQPEKATQDDILSSEIATMKLAIAELSRRVERLEAERQ